MGYWILAAIAIAAVLALLVFTAEMLMQELEIRREEREKAERAENIRRLAYRGRHDEDGDTIRMPIPTGGVL